MKPLDHFHSIINSEKPRIVLELGTKRSNPDNPTHHKHWFNYAELDYIMTDFQHGLDVDLIADAHELSKHFEPESVDCLVSCSTFEHFQKPWVVSKEIQKILKPNATFFIQTHFIFCEHAYPSDYFRYTTEGLKSIFDWALEPFAAYEFPATIQSEFNPHGQKGPSFLNVTMFGRK